METDMLPPLARRPEEKDWSNESPYLRDWMLLMGQHNYEFDAWLYDGALARCGRRPEPETVYDLGERQYRERVEVCKRHGRPVPSWVVEEREKFRTWPEELA